MKVTIVDRDQMAENWGRGPGGIVLKTIDIADSCPVCGGPRGTPRWNHYCEDGEWYDVNNWENPCGHLDTYVSVLQEFNYENKKKDIEKTEY